MPHTVTVPANFVAYASVFIGQAIGLQVSGSQVVGAGIGIVGFLLASLISLSVHLVAKRLGSIEAISTKNAATLTEQSLEIRLIRSELTAVSTWKKEREAAHQKENDDQVKALQDELYAISKLK